MSDDISRRIDDLLGGAIDEQVREQRALNDLMLGVRDGVARLVGDVAALSARVTESRETSQGLREELPFLVQREVGTAVNAMSVRIDVLETAVGELVASLAGLEDRVGPDVIIGGISARLEAMRAAQDDQAGAVTAEMARSTIQAASDSMRTTFEDEAASMRDSFEQASTGMTDLVERQQGQIAKRLGEIKKWADEVEGRMRALEKALEANLKMPGDVRKQLNELTGATQDMTDSVLEEIRINAEAAAGRITVSVEGLDHEAIEMNRRFAEMNDRIAAFQEQVLAYLQVRDLALEEHRDQIVTELLADFLNAMPAKERDRAASGLRGVLERRRDKRDAERFRAGGAAPASQLPAVPPEAMARARAEIQREERLAERPWAERSWAEPASPQAGSQAAPAPRAADPEPDQGYEPAYNPGYEDQDQPAYDGSREAPERPGRRAAPPVAKTAKQRPAKKPVAKKAPAKKAPAKKAPAKQAAPKPVAPASKRPSPSRPVAVTRAAAGRPGRAGSSRKNGPNQGLDTGLDEEIFEDAQTPTAEVTEAGEIDVVDLDAFATPDASGDDLDLVRGLDLSPDHDGADLGDESGDGDSEPVRAPKTAKSPAPAKKSRKESAAPAASQPASQSSSADAGGSAAGAGGSNADDTLTQALARVQALVDQHRKPGAARKPKR